MILFRTHVYYRDNLEVILRIIPGYDKNTLIEAIRICLDKGIYNGDSVKSLCEYVCRGKENGTEIYGLEDHLPRQGGLIHSNSSLHTMSKSNVSLCFPNRSVWNVEN